MVRYADGRLCEAPREMRERMLQVYYPRYGRHMRPPSLLKDENITVISFPTVISLQLSVITGIRPPPTFNAVVMLVQP